MSVHKMMGLHPSPAANVEALATAAKHAAYCALFCTSCADACLAEDMDMTTCIRLDLDCAEACAAAARVLARQTATDETARRAIVEACIAACEACAAECERHDHDHCRLCAEMCRECARDCRAALN
ncbi:four-helix bundle copper-binding protein [Sphingomonas jatrophae]|uniref:Four-helix bundle copper-binding protein n=1 Tax=Sphingomonas jatrophae TaxID=1166337 RepID=A0A1I6LLT3_9SPHN|nr:four-helix bundle copper-binding protein [Sphingomonas jatrophae]SFS04328.1 protein of unknown function [Sphingomonas jatrophae]